MSADEGLHAEHHRQSQPLGVDRSRLGRLDHDAQVIARRKKGVAVELYRPDRRVVDGFSLRRFFQIKAGV